MTWTFGVRCESCLSEESVLVCHCGYLMCPSCWHESGGCDYEKGILRDYDRHGVHGIDWQETVLINRSHQRSPPDWPLPGMEADSAVGEAASTSAELAAVEAQAQRM